MLSNNQILKKYLELFLKLIDLLIIQFKFGCLVTLYIRYHDSDKPLKNVYMHLIIPFALYGFVNLFRLLFNKETKILFLEIIMNLVFVFLYGTNHLFFLMLTVISTIIVFVLNSKMFQSV